MFTSADAIQKDNKDNAAISQDAQRRNAGLIGSTNNPDGAAAAECSFAMSEYSNTMSATAEQNVNFLLFMNITDLMLHLFS